VIVVALSKKNDASLTAWEIGRNMPVIYNPNMIHALGMTEIEEREKHAVVAVKINRRLFSDIETRELQTSIAPLTSCYSQSGGCSVTAHRRSPSSMVSSRYAGSRRRRS